MAFTSVRYLVPRSLEPDAVSRLSRRFELVAGAAEARIRWQRSQPEGGWRELAGTDDHGRHAPENGAALRWIALGDNDAPSDWRATWEVQPGRWTLSVRAPNEEVAWSAGELMAGELAAERLECLALSFSGGGFRATLFHLGFVRLLADAGLLSGVTHICSVSCGS
ncbi:MAG: hypothetical protein ACKO38_08865, partial [Planctomycetota bacterium]